MAKQLPNGGDIIRDVFKKIEHNDAWSRRYTNLKAELSKDVENKWIGKYTKYLTRMKNVRLAPAKDVSIISSYTKLRH